MKPWTDTRPWTVGPGAGPDRDRDRLNVNWLDRFLDRDRLPDPINNRYSVQHEQMNAKIQILTLDFGFAL